MTRQKPGGHGAGAALAAVGAAALWGTTGTAQALGPDGTDPAAVGAARVLLGAVVLVLLARLQPGGTGTPGRLRGAGPVGLVLLGGLSVAAYQALFFLGVARAGVAVGTVVALGVAPLATGLLGLLLGERVGARWALATAGAVAGVLLLVAGSGGGTGRPDLLGIGAALGAGAAYAGYTVAARALLVRGMPGLRVMAWFFALGAVLLSPALVARHAGRLGTPPGLLMVLWLGVAATGLSYVLFQRGLSELPASTIATLSLAEPVTATLLGVLVLRERLSPLTALGIAVVVLSLLLMAVRRRSRPPDGIP